MKTAAKAKTKKAAEAVKGPLQEVRPLREVPGVPEHCGQPMRRLSGVSTTTGRPVFVYTCANECGVQVRMPTPGQD